MRHLGAEFLKNFVAFNIFVPVVVVIPLPKIMWLKKIEICKNKNKIGTMAIMDDGGEDEVGIFWILKLVVFFCWCIISH